MKIHQIGIVVGLMGLSTVAVALPAFFTTFGTTYNIKKDSPLDKASCAVCHVSKTSKVLNPYGQDIKKTLTAMKTKAMTADVLKKVEKLDSDKDGVKNGAEIKAGTLPGDPKSVKK